MTQQPTRRPRLIIELGERSDSDLDELVKIEHTNKTTVINRAIQLMRLLRDLESKGIKFMIETPEGDIAQMHLAKD